MGEATPLPTCIIAHFSPNTNTSYELYFLPFCMAPDTTARPTGGENNHWPHHSPDLQHKHYFVAEGPVIQPEMQQRTTVRTDKKRSKYANPVECLLKGLLERTSTYSLYMPKHSHNIN